MAAQNEKYEEAISMKSLILLIILGISEKQISFLKEKFLSDVKDLEAKINIYFNQNDSHKRSLSPKREKKNIEKIFENYSNAASHIAHVRNMPITLMLLERFHH